MRIFDELFSLEKRNNNGLLIKHSRFIKKSAWYVNEHYMKILFTYPLIPSSNKIPGLYRTKIFGLMKNFVLNQQTHEMLPSAADAIQIKLSGERLRAFFSIGKTQRHTVKVVCDSNRNKFIEITKNEISIRQMLASFKTINVPKIIATEQSASAFILFEEMIPGRRFNARIDKTLYRENMLPQLRDTYLAYGVKYVPVGDVISLEMHGKIELLVSTMPNSKQFRTALWKIIEKNSAAAVSICHGGLRPCNIAIADDKVYFLDWKFSNEGFIITDLLRTAVKYPKLDYIIQNIRETLTTNFTNTGCNFEDLLTVGIALEMLRVPGNSPGLLQLWQRNVTMGSAA
jgi:hypothetical protein